MSTYTEHYSLDKYEGSDRPNLRDQYNAAMDKIDAELYIQGTAATGAADAVRTLGATVENLGRDLSSETLSREQADTRLQEEIDNIDVTVPSKILIIGDSFTDWSGTWVTSFATKIGRPVQSYARGGAGFTTGGLNTFQSQLQSAINNEDMSEVSDIIVYGGVNDFTDAHAAVSAMASAFASFYNLYETIAAPRPKLHMCFGNIGLAQQNAYNGFYHWYNSCMDSLRESGHAGLVESVPYWHMNRTSCFGTDNLHPNNKGMAVIASYMSQIIDGTYTGVHTKASYPIVHDGVTAVGRTYISLDDGVLTISPELGSAITFNNITGQGFRDLFQVTNLSAQCSLRIGTDSAPNAKGWLFGPLINLFVNGSACCLTRLMYNSGNNVMYLQILGDVSLLPGGSFTIDGTLTSFTVLPGSYQ